MKYRRTRKEQNRDSQQHYGGLAEKEPDGKAAQRFIHKAYSCYGKEKQEPDNGKAQI